MNHALINKRQQTNSYITYMIRGISDPDRASCNDQRYLRSNGGDAGIGCVKVNPQVSCNKITVDVEGNGVIHKHGTAERSDHRPG